MLSKLGFSLLNYIFTHAILSIIVMVIIENLFSQPNMERNIFTSRTHFTMHTITSASITTNLLASLPSSPNIDSRVHICLVHLICSLAYHAFVTLLRTLMALGFIFSRTSKVICPLVIISFKKSQLDILQSLGSSILKMPLNFSKVC